MYHGQFEIVSYTIGAWCAKGFEATIGLFLNNGPNRNMFLRTTPQAGGIQYPIMLWFSDDAEGEGVGSIFKTTETATGKKVDAFLISLPESYYADIYAILRSEKPVFFSYLCDRPFPAPFMSIVNGEVHMKSDDDYNTVRGVNFTTGMEPVGEGIDSDSFRKDPHLDSIFRKYSERSSDM